MLPTGSGSGAGHTNLKSRSLQKRRLLCDIEFVDSVAGRPLLSSFHRGLTIFAIVAAIVFALSLLSSFH